MPSITTFVTISLLVLVVWMNIRKKGFKKSVTLSPKMIEISKLFDDLAISKTDTNHISIYGSDYATFSIKVDKDKIIVQATGTSPLTSNDFEESIQLPLNASNTEIQNSINKHLDKYLKEYKEKTKRPKLTFFEFLAEEAKLYDIMEYSNELIYVLNEMKNSLLTQDKELLSELSDDADVSVENYNIVCREILKNKVDLESIIIIDINEKDTSMSIMDVLEKAYAQVEWISKQQPSLGVKLAPIDKMAFAQQYAKDVLQG